MSIKGIGNGAERPADLGERRTRETAFDRDLRRPEGDRLDLSVEAVEIRRLIEAANELPAVREARVAELRERIDSGTYEVDPRRVANAILEESDAG